MNLLLPQTSCRLPGLHIGNIHASDFCIAFMLVGRTVIPKISRVTLPVNRSAGRNAPTKAAENIARLLVLPAWNPVSGSVVTLPVLLIVDPSARAFPATNRAPIPWIAAMPVLLYVEKYARSRIAYSVWTIPRNKRSLISSCSVHYTK
jgi:hypothetical protein